MPLLSPGSSVGIPIVIDHGVPDPEGVADADFRFARLAGRGICWNQLSAATTSAAGRPYSDTTAFAGLILPRQMGITGARTGASAVPGKLPDGSTAQSSS